MKIRGYYGIEGKWNRWVSDFRCFVGNGLIRLGSKVTDSHVLDSRNRFRWERRW